MEDAKKAREELENIMKQIKETNELTQSTFVYLLLSLAVNEYFKLICNGTKENGKQWHIEEIENVFR